MAKGEKWMQEAFSNSRGQFKAKAKKAGKSTAEYAKENSKAGGKLGKQATLAKTAIKISRARGRG